MREIYEDDKLVHSKKNLRYEECYAKVLLENLFPERYYNLEIEDRPDLIFYPKGIGIEVTDCTPKYEKEVLNLWLKIPRQRGKCKQRSLDRLRQLGYTYREGGIIWEAKVYSENLECSPLETVFDAVSKKIKKLNDRNYKMLNEYNLFIHSGLFIPDFLMGEFFNRLCDINQGDLIFNSIYLLTNQNTIIVFDMLQKNGYVKAFKEKQVTYSIKAKEIMERQSNE